MLQASSQLPSALDTISKLLTHESFDLGNPNKVYALIGTFGSSNPQRFHDNEGKGYDFLAKRVVELNQRNPQVAANVLNNNLTQWKRLDEPHRSLMKKALGYIQSAGNLSPDVNEIVTKSLD